MKYIISIIIAVTICDLVYSQDYQYFPISNAAWKERCVITSGSSNTEFNFYHLELGQDTLINNLIYHKILKTGTKDNWHPNIDIVYYNNDYIGAIREDTSRHIYFVPALISQEELLYDFNLSVGDTLQYMYGMEWETNYIVESIDSVLVLNTYHKKYRINPDGYLESFDIIDGVGSTLGLLTKLTIPQVCMTVI